MLGPFALMDILLDNNNSLKNVPTGYGTGLVLTCWFLKDHGQPTCQNFRDYFERAIERGNGHVFSHFGWGFCPEDENYLEVTNTVQSHCAPQRVHAAGLVNLTSFVSEVAKEKVKGSRSSISGDLSDQVADCLLNFFFTKVCSGSNPWMSMSLIQDCVRQTN